MTIAEQGLDNQPIRFGICIAGQDSNNYDQRGETEGCQLQQEDRTEKIFRYKLEGVVAAVIMSYTGHHMINQN
jgi:hypothetical protein